MVDGISRGGDSRGVAVLTISVLFTAFAYAAVTLRVIARRQKHIVLAPNDYLIFTALAFTTGLMCVLTVDTIHGGLGRQEIDVSLDELSVFSKLFVSGQPLWSGSNTFVKLSILQLYCTMFSSRKTFKRIVYIFMMLVLCFAASDWLKLFLICRPFRYSWDKSIKGHCGKIFTGWLLIGIGNLFLDVGTIILPLPQLWRLQLPTSKKVGLMTLFSIGALICIISIMRIASIQSLVESNESNITYTLVPSRIWTIMEPTIGIITASIPILWPLIQPRLGTASAQIARKIRTCASERTSMLFGKTPNASLGITHDDRFQRSGDEHLLEEGVNCTTVKKVPIVTTSEVRGDGPHNGKGYESGQPPKYGQLVKPDAIHVTKSWRVSSAQYQK